MILQCLCKSGQLPTIRWSLSTKMCGGKVQQWAFIEHSISSTPVRCMYHILPLYTVCKKSSNLIWYSICVCSLYVHNQSRSIISWAVFLDVQWKQVYLGVDLVIIWTQHIITLECMGPKNHNHSLVALDQPLFVFPLPCMFGTRICLFFVSHLTSPLTGHIFSQ